MHYVDPGPECKTDIVPHRPAAVLDSRLVRYRG